VSSPSLNRKHSLLLELGELSTFPVDLAETGTEATHAVATTCLSTNKEQGRRPTCQHDALCCGDKLGSQRGQRSPAGRTEHQVRFLAIHRDPFHEYETINRRKHKGDETFLNSTNHTDDRGSLSNFFVGKEKKKLGILAMASTVTATRTVTATIRTTAAAVSTAAVTTTTA
jgi:hypothetical protein